MFLRNKLFLTSSLILFGLTFEARAIVQQSGSNAGQSGRGATVSQSSDDDDTPPLGSPQQEMLARNAIRHLEKLHDENVERAREAARLGSMLRDTHLHSKTLGEFDKKNLERLEKVTRRIRSAAGGSDGTDSGDSLPQDVEPALARLATATEALATGVSKTPRLVVSALVIERANEVLELVRYLRAHVR